MGMYQNMLVSRLVGKASEHYDWTNSKSLDGIPVCTALYDFGMALRGERAFRGVKFGIEHDTGMIRSNVHVYIPGHVYALGIVGYGNYVCGDSERWSYLVSSQHVDNNKYKPLTPARAWSLSTNIDRAIVNARKFLRPYSVTDIALYTSDLATTSFSRVKNDYDMKVFRAFSELSEDMGKQQSSIIFAEMKRMMANGYEFENSKVKDMIQTAITAVSERGASQTALSNVALVFSTPHVVPDMPPNINVVLGGQVALNSQIRSNLHTIFGNSMYVQNNATMYQPSEVPEDIAAKLTVLSMVENDTFIEGVGYKVDERIVYVLY
jgi:hypothetical protein